MHTAYSADALTNPKALVESIYANPSVKAVAITDHNTMDGYYKVRKLAEVYKGEILIIPGVELRTQLGDLIALGIEELPVKPWTVENIIDFTREREGIIVVPHPYRAPGLGDLATNYNVDAIEVLNGSTSSFLNEMAEKLAKAMNLPGVAGSDAHTLNQLFTVYTEVEVSDLSIHAILKSIKNGAVRAVSARDSIHF